MDQANENEKIPWVAWTSLLSIDAVLVAVTWQMLFIRSFLGRGPMLAESVALGATVWLIYVADRLLDASRLELTLPHTLRHRFYRRHASAFRFAWVMVLLCVVGVVVSSLRMELIQCGLMLAAAVLVYGAGVHFLPRPRCMGASSWWRIPKEIQVGGLFAMGVSLVCWTEMFAVPVAGRREWVFLSLATWVSAMVFSCNCLLVSRWEAELDAAQSFSTRDACEATGLHLVLTVLGLGMVPMTVGLAASADGLWGSVAIAIVGMMVMHFREGHGALPVPWLTRFERRGVWVDWLLWMPPLLISGW